MEDWKELIGDFLEEAYSLLENLEESLLTLEKDLSDKNGIDVVFRVAHTLKGGAGAVGFSDITKLTHIMEDVLDLVRLGKYTFSNNDISLLLNIKDELELLLKAHENNQQHPFTQTAHLISELEKIKSSTLNTPIESSIEKEIEESYQYSIDHLPLAARFCITYEILESLHESLIEQEELRFIEVRLNEEYEMKEVGPFEILNIINSIGEPIIMNPSPESLDEEYIPFLNIVIPSTESPEYIQSRLSLAEVTTQVTVKAFTKELYDHLDKEMHHKEMENMVSPTPELLTDPIVPEINTVTPNTEQTPNDTSEKRNHTLKVESSRIDELLNLLGELVIIRSGLTQFGSELEKAIYNSRLNLRAFLSSQELIPLHNDPIVNKSRNDQFREDFSVINSSIDNFIEYIQQLSRISSTLQIRMMNLRMVPVQTVFSRFTRLTRDIAKQLNKQVELIIEGGETEIDKSIIDDLYDPLMHMIRNSLDHGIETPEERIAQGKNTIGIIHLKAYQEGDAIYIEISDNGKGIDANKIAEKALSKGFITEHQLTSMSSQEKLSLILLAGFSTAEQISNLSGRGVGMDVVNRTIQELGGSVRIRSELGQSTNMRIQLPLTLAIIQGLVILIEKVHFVIPITSVEETIIFNKDSLHKLDQYYAIKFRDKLIPLISLTKLLYDIDSLEEITPEDTDIENFSTQNITLKHQYCIIVRYGNRQVGIIVPEILQEQDIVVKPLDNRLIYSPGISAATIVGNGEIGFILDITQIVRYYLGGKH